MGPEEKAEELVNKYREKLIEYRTRIAEEDGINIDWWKIHEDSEHDAISHCNEQIGKWIRVIHAIQHRKTDYDICDHCGGHGADLVYDPLIEEVHDELVETYLCDKCYEERLWDF